MFRTDPVRFIRQRGAEGGQSTTHKYIIVLEQQHRGGELFAGGGGFFSPLKLFGPVSARFS